MNPTINPQVTGLQVFYNENENISIRTEMKGGEPWFVAKDVAMALDIDWSGKTLKSIPEEWKGMGSFPIYGSEDDVSGVRRMVVINESAMYKLAFRSNKPEADRFVNWIAGEVLPSIRCTGSYSSNGVQSPVEEPSKKLPLPKYRPFFENWKGCVNPYLSYVEAYAVAKNLNVSYSHVRKVFMGTAVSERVARALTEKALDNKRRGVAYEPQRPVYEQLSIEWENKVVTL
ncbi:BRO-N domain-containing protein [Bacteroides fragilis]|uniref:BRO-N domain-containing protein n=1 Tax=Bacteroides fragilis TaxID=817 RepID=UPI00202E054B|nr:BRO family protein [Bacteroides fragilis]MCM0315909.1 hypothetical protein [Bacteroides fragilis]